MKIELNWFNLSSPLPGAIARLAGREPLSFAIRAFLSVSYASALAKTTSNTCCARTLATSTFGSNFRSSRCCQHARHNNTRTCQWNDDHNNEWHTISTRHEHRSKTFRKRSPNWDSFLKGTPPLIGNNLLAGRFVVNHSFSRFSKNVLWLLRKLFGGNEWWFSHKLSHRQQNKA